MTLYINKKSEIERELEAEDNAMSTIYDAIIDNGGAIKWVKMCLDSNTFNSIDEVCSLFNRMEMNFVKLEEYEKALYINNELNKL